MTSLDGSASEPIVEIERASIDNADAILKLCYLAYQSEAELYGDWTIPPLFERLRDVIEAIEHGTVLVARLNDEVVGSVRARRRDDVTEVGKLVVHPRLQRKGIGTRLLVAIERHADGRIFEVFTGHRSEGNLRLYRFHGYREIRRDVVSPKLTMVVMRKLL